MRWILVRRNETPVRPSGKAPERSSRSARDSESRPGRVAHQVRPGPLPRCGKRRDLHGRGGGRLWIRRRRKRRWLALAFSDRHDGIEVHRTARLHSAGGPRRARQDGRSDSAARHYCVGAEGGGGVPPVGDRPGAPPTVVEDDVDPRARRQRCEAFQQFDRFEQQVRGAVAPFRFQGQEHAAIGGARQPLLRDRRPEHVARKLFEAVAIVRRDGDVGVEVEALEVGLARAGGGHPGHARHAPEL